MGCISAGWIYGRVHVCVVWDPNELARSSEVQERFF